MRAAVPTSGDDETLRGTRRTRLRRGRWPLWVAVAAVFAGSAILVLDRGREMWWIAHAERLALRYSLNGERVTGFFLRGDGADGRKQLLTAWYDDTGFLAIDAEILSGEPGRCTVWRPDGTVWYQLEPEPSWKLRPNLSGSRGRRTESSPWRWGERPEARPTAPWLAGERSVEGWFEEQMGSVSR